MYSGPRLPGLTLLVTAFLSENIYSTWHVSGRGAEWLTLNVSVSCRNGLLYTLNGQCPQPRWDAVQRDFQVAAESFNVLSSRKTIPGWGNRLLQ